jgi:glyoxylase-like metal-dependent hydrolase (beta-lactamase superfamily II)
MLAKSFAEILRRRFLLAGSISVAAARLDPRELFAGPGDDLIESALKQAASTKITFQRLRRNVALLGAGGNMAVLTGPDAKFVVDAEIVAARPHVVEALRELDKDPIKQLINTHWHFDHTGGNVGSTNPAPASWPTKIPASIFPRTSAWRAIGSTLSQPPRKSNSLHCI